MAVKQLLVLLAPTLLPDPSSAAPQVLVRYLDLPAGAQPQTISAGASGSLFVVSNIIEPSGRPQIRVLKIDSNGATLASMDFGGSSRDTIAGASVDATGNLVLVGSTSSSDFPLVSPLISSTSTPAAFVTKIDSQLRGILFSTKLGGSQQSEPYGVGTSAGAMTLDKAGNIYVTGTTFNTDFPITPGAFQSSPPPSNAFGTAQYAYLTEISSDGKKILFSTYFGDGSVVCSGGSRCVGQFGSTRATAVALDQAGNVVIAGATTADKLPVTPGVYAPQCRCTSSLAAGFLAKFTASGSTLLWATYLPIMGVPFQPDILIAAMSLDSAGDVLVAGSVGDGSPVTPQSLQSTVPPPNEYAGFISEFDPTAQRLLSSTYFGTGASLGVPTGVAGLAIDTQGAIWITGSASPASLPAPPNTPLLGDTYVASLASDLSAITFLITAPSGAAGRAITFSEAEPIALGSASSLLLVGPAAGPSLAGIANAAASTVSNAVAPYELISLYGIDIGPTPPLGAQLAGNVVTSSLGGVQVLFDGIAAPLLYAGPTQINAIVPAEVFGQDTTTITVITPSGTLAGPTMLVRPSQPGVFSVALNQDGSLNTAANPAAPGSIVTVWATGGGISTLPQPDGTILTGALGAPLLPVSILQYDLTAPGAVSSLEILYAGDAPDMLAGVSQINFRLPSQTPSPPQTSFALQIGAAISAFNIYVEDP
ncbi:MAG TPA: SBBP repeat-containing protein [Bryobacteraceae bacterium]|nr:SBBP repeat-containing protein [Bryobacteraceae bacterium]